MKTILIILGAAALVALLILLQLAAFRRRHPNAELLIEAMKMIAEKKIPNSKFQIRTVFPRRFLCSVFCSLM